MQRQTSSDAKETDFPGSISPSEPPSPSSGSSVGDRTVVRGSREFQVRAVSISAPSPNFLPRLRGRDGELQRQSSVWPVGP